MRFLLQTAAVTMASGHNHHSQQRPFHLNAAASVVIVFCGLGASISFMSAIALYFWCFRNRSPATQIQSSSAIASTEINQENRAIREKISRKLVERLPLAIITISKSDHDNPVSVDCCSVCLAEFDQAAGQDSEEEHLRIRQLPDCGHYFHSECIQLWLVSYLSCPLCRRSLANLVLDQDPVQQQQQQSSSVAQTVETVTTTMTTTSADETNVINSDQAQEHVAIVDNSPELGGSAAIGPSDGGISIKVNSSS